MTTQTFPLSGPINLLAKYALGSLTVQARDNLTEASVDVVAHNPASTVLDQVSVSMDGPTLTINGPKPRGGLLEFAVFGGGNDSSEAIDVTVVIPSGTAMKVTTLSNRITVDGRVGGVDIAGRSTEVALDAVDGDIRLRSGNGSAQVGRVTGSVQIRSGASDVTIGEVAGSVDVGIGSGALRVGSVRDSVRMRAGSGDVELGEAGGNVDITTGSGELVIGLAPGQQARLDVMTGHGNLNTEMPVQQRPAAAAGFVKAARPTTIRARTGNGDVTIRRSARPEAAAG